MRFDAYLTDGKSAQRRAVRVHFDIRRLLILDEEGKRLDDWPLEGLRLAEAVYRDQPVRLAHRERGETRLTFADQQILETLAKAQPGLLGRAAWQRVTPARMFAVAMVLVVALVALMWLLPGLAGILAGWVPRAWEEAWGERVAAGMESRFDYCSGAAGRDALEGLTVRLAAFAGSGYTYRVRVVDHEGVNAYAFPGGRIVIFRGLIETAAGPDEVAGVLAHEMAHVVERHPTEALLRAVGFGLIADTLVGDLTGPSELLADFGGRLAGLSYGREAEREADRVGMEILRKAGIGTEGQIGFLHRMAQAGGPGQAVPEFLSTHPDPGARAAALEALARESGGAEPESKPALPALNEDQWRALKTVCEP